MKRQLVAVIMIATMTLAILGSAVVMATPADGYSPTYKKPLVRVASSFNVHGAQVIDNMPPPGYLIFTQSSPPKTNKLATTAYQSFWAGQYQEGTNIAYLGVNWHFSDTDWKNLKDTPVIVGATVSYKLSGGGTSGSQYGSSSSTVVLGAGNDPAKPDPAKPLPTMTLAYATASAGNAYKASASGATGQLGPTTLAQLTTQPGEVTIWVALQTHLIGGITGNTIASGDVTVQSIYLKSVA